MLSCPSEWESWMLLQLSRLWWSNTCTDAVQSIRRPDQNTCWVVSPKAANLILAAPDWHYSLEMRQTISLKECTEHFSPPVPPLCHYPSSKHAGHGSTADSDSVGISSDLGGWDVLVEDSIGAGHYFPRDYWPSSADLLRVQRDRVGAMGVLTTLMPFWQQMMLIDRSNSFHAQ